MHSIYDSDDFLQDIRMSVWHAGVDPDKFESVEAFVAYYKKSRATKANDVTGIGS